MEDPVKANERALSARPAQDQTRQFRPISEHDQDLHALKRHYRYLGYVEVEIEGAAPFVMLLNDDDQVAYIYFWYGRDAFETLSLRLWTELAKQSEVILDIGAFTGVYTLAAAASNRQASIHSFEPVSLVFSRLLTNLTANKLGKKVPGTASGRARAITVSNMAVGNLDGETHINQFRNELTIGTGASLIEKPNKVIKHNAKVRQVTIDSYAQENGLNKIDLLKADVEQAELIILEGAHNVLSRNRPSLLIEVSSRQNLEALSEILGSYGYNFALINDQAQNCSINDVTKFSRVCNVLFSYTSEADLKELCNSIKPIAKSSGKNRDRQRALGPSRLNEQLSEQTRRSERLEQELWEIKSSRSWRLARMISATIERLQNLIAASRRT